MHNNISFFSERCRPHNLLPVAIIPGSLDKQPADLDNFLRPLITELKAGFRPGLTFRTAAGVDVKYKFVLLSLNCDMPAGRKLLGVMTHNAKSFCHVCTRVYRRDPPLVAIPAARAAKNKPRNTIASNLDAANKKKPKVRKIPIKRYYWEGGGAVENMSEPRNLAAHKKVISDIRAAHAQADKTLISKNTGYQHSVTSVDICRSVSILYSRHDAWIFSRPRKNSQQVNVRKAFQQI